jgi:hypothetical protein
MTLDIDSTTHTPYENQQGARSGINLENPYSAAIGFMKREYRSTSRKRGSISLLQ